MAINDETRRLARYRRQRLVDTTRATELALAEAWADTWDDLQAEYTRSLDRIVADLRDGQQLTTAHLERSQLIQDSMGITHDRLEELAGQSETIMVDDLDRIVNEQPPWVLDELRSQLPPGRSGSRLQFARPNHDALAAIVARSTERIHSRAWPLSEHTEQTMRQALTRGIAAGDNPRATANRIMQDTQGAFEGGLGRAMTIARTEQLDAARWADQLTHEANTDLIHANVWMCEIDDLTCFACLAMHGSQHAPDAWGPEGHPNCRCTFITRLKSWTELGLGEGLPEPPDVLDGDEAQHYLDSLTDESLRQRMGPGRYELYANGDITLEDFAVHRDNPDWRPAYYERSLKDML